MVSRALRSPQQRQLQHSYLQALAVAVATRQQQYPRTCTSYSSSTSTRYSNTNGDGSISCSSRHECRMTSGSNMTAEQQANTSSTRHSQGGSSSQHWRLPATFHLHPRHSQQPSTSQLGASGVDDDLYSTLQGYRTTRRLRSTTPASYRAHFLRQEIDHLQQILAHAPGACCTLFGACLRSISCQLLSVSAVALDKGSRCLVLSNQFENEGGSVEQAFQVL